MRGSLLSAAILTCALTGVLTDPYAQDLQVWAETLAGAPVAGEHERRVGVGAAADAGLRG